MNGLCICIFPFTGEACEKDQCRNKCSGHGTCSKNGCMCDQGWKGDDCSIPTCITPCPVNAKCINGQCVCNEGFLGPKCEKYVKFYKLKIN